MEVAVLDAEPLPRIRAPAGGSSALRKPGIRSHQNTFALPLEWPSGPPGSCLVRAQVSATLGRRPFELTDAVVFPALFFFSSLAFSPDRQQRLRSDAGCAFHAHRRAPCFRGRRPAVKCFFLRHRFIGRCDSVLAAERPKCRLFHSVPCRGGKNYSHSVFK